MNRIPDEGILSALENKKYAKNVPVIFGSNKDELSLWFGVNNYFLKEPIHLQDLYQSQKLN